MEKSFIKKRINLGEITRLNREFHSYGLNTVCESAKCPNIGECFQRSVATFLIAGNICTRNCSFCGINKGKPLPPDPKEPSKVAKNIKNLKIRYAVITSVTRDDLKDGGAEHFKNTVKEIRNLCPEVKVELLVPDFKGDRKALEKVISSKPDVLGHNLETVPRLYTLVRKGADYKRSLELLSWAKCNNMKTKSGIMLGLGEQYDEILKTMDDLAEIGCRIITLGQYLAPTAAHFSVKEIISEKTFEKLKLEALKRGFSHCASGTYVRSSYMAEEMV